MKTKRTRWWLKSAALLCATVFGLTAFGDYWNAWSAEEGVGYWEDSSSWTYGTVADGTLQWRVGYDGAAVKFKTAAAPEAGELHLHGGTATFTADASETDVANGLTVGVANVGVWYGGAATAEFTSGAYNFTTLNVGRWSNAGTVNINGGTVYAGTIWNGVTNGDTGATTAGSVTLTSGELKLGAGGIFSDPAGTFTIAGGTLTATAPTDWLVNGTAMVVNGGTINTDYDVTILSALTGSGTLTKTGTGTLAITGSIAGFAGKIAVAEGAGSVTVGDITIAAGEEVQFGVYTWTGAGTPVEPEEEGGEVTYTDTDLWSNVNNWLVNGAVPATAPAADSTVVIPEGDGTELSIRISGTGDCTGFLTINRDVKFVRPNSNTNGWGIRVSKVEGTGKLTLLGNGRSSPLVYDWLHIYTGQATDGEIIIDTDLVVESYVTLEGTTPLRVNGAFSGGARFTCYSNDGQQGVHFHGDTSGFTGSYTGGTRASGSRDGTKFYGSALGGESASWSFGGDFSTNSGYSPLKAGNGVTYKFGQLTTSFDGYGRLTFETYHKSSNSDYASNVTLEVGGRANSTSDVGGAIDGTNNKIVKVGDTSTLNLTLTANTGAVEAKEGTTVLKGTIAPATLTFTGTGATVKIANTVGTYETTTVVDTEEYVDEETGETVPAVTHDVTTQIAGFVPTLSAELAGCLFATDTETIDEVEYTVYTLADVAKDANEVAYKSVALAVAALADAEDKTITLTANTTEAVVLPLGYTLVMGEFTAGSVAGTTGVAVSYDEETKTWTTVNNSAATWTGAVNNWWHEPGNWSTGYVPDEGTDVTFDKAATIQIYDYSGDGNGNSLHKCKNIKIGKFTVTLRFPEDGTQANYWPRLDVYGNIEGTDSRSTLKLYRCGLRNMKGGSISFAKCKLNYENDGTNDSWLEGGDFTFANFDVSGTGFLRLLNGTYTFSGGSNGGLNIPEGSKVECTKAPHFSHADEYLSGAGRIIIGSAPATRFGDALKRSSWTGTCELNGFAINGIDTANYGNANSTVCFNGVSGYLAYQNNATKTLGTVGAIEIGANGLTLNNGFSTSSPTGYIIHSPLKGSGTITVGTTDSVAGNYMYYFFTGDVSEFTGSINFGEATTSNAGVVYFKKAADLMGSNAATSKGQIYVQSGASINIGSTWTAPGGFVINGEATINGGRLEGGDVTGTGTVTLASRTGSGEVQLGKLGAEGLTVVVEGINGTDANSIYLDGDTINSKVVLNGLLKLTNGSTGKNYTFAEVSGSGDMFLSATGSPNKPTYTYTFTKLTDYTGTINAVKTADDKYAALAIGTIDVSEVVMGEPVLKLATAANLATDPADIDVTVNGEATEAQLFKADDGNLYVAAAEVTVTTPAEEEGGEDTVTTKTFESYEAAAAFADENGVTEIAVLYGDGVFNGWDYDSETGKLTKNSNVAKIVGGDEYATLADAVTAAQAGDTIVLFRDSGAGQVSLGEGITLEVEAGVRCDGTTFVGAGTIVLADDASLDATALVSGNWTGTAVINWAVSGGLKVGKYGRPNSTIEIAKDMTGYFTNQAGNGNPNNDAMIAIDEGVTVTLTDGYTAGSSFGGLTGAGNLVLDASAKGWTGYTSENFKLVKDFTGTVTVKDKFAFKTESVYLAEVPEVGAKIVSIVTAGGKIRNASDEYVDEGAAVATSISGVTLVYKANGADGAGLYFDPVAKITTTSYNSQGDPIYATTYYPTLTAAVAEAGNNAITLLADNDEEIVVALGSRVKIAKNGFNVTGIAAAEGYTLKTTDTTDTVGGETVSVTIYQTVQVTAVVTVPGSDPVEVTDAIFMVLNTYQNSAVGTTIVVSESIEVSEQVITAFSTVYKYDAETKTFTIPLRVASYVYSNQEWKFSTLAAACADADTVSVTTVMLLVDIKEIDEEVPTGWEYNAPAEGEEGYGTLTKVVTPETITVKDDDCDFTVDAATAAAITEATGVATDSENFGKAAIAYVVGGALEKGEVVIPTPTITVNGTTVTVVYDSKTAHADAYTVTCTLYSFSLEDVADSTKWTVEATGAIGDALEDTGVTDTKKFYKVGVTVEDKDAQVGNETGSGTGA